MREVLGSCDHPEGFGQDGRGVGRLVAWVDELGRSRKAFVDDPLRGSALQDPLASSIVGLVEAPQQGLEIAMAGHRDPEPLGLNASVEALHHALGLGRVGARLAVRHPELSARRLEPGGREA
jgi:hypothetical protein